MSRIGKAPITVPAGVTVTIGDDNLVTVKGPKGELQQQVADAMKVELKDGELTVERPNDEKENRGLYRPVEQHGGRCYRGFRKELELVGVGYAFPTVARC